MVPTYLDAQDGKRFAPLHIAAWAGNTDMVEILIDQGANVGIKDRFGN